MNTFIDSCIEGLLGGLVAFALISCVLEIAGVLIYSVVRP
jgi:hypothetical protein